MEGGGFEGRVRMAGVKYGRRKRERLREREREQWKTGLILKESLA